MASYLLQMHTDMLQLQHQLLHLEQELTVRDQKLATLTATLNMIQEEMMANDEAHASTRAENTHLKVRNVASCPLCATHGRGACDHSV